MEFYEKRLDRLEKTISKIRNENDKLIQLILEQPTELLYDKYIQSEKRKIHFQKTKTCLYML